MGRYSSVQAYADTNQNMRSVPYEQAAGTSANAPSDGTRQPAVAAKPEKVVNPYGSTAGAGSGEFHVYRHARAREMQRLANMDQEEQVELLDKEYQSTLLQNKTEEELRTEKRRKKRKREKEAKLRKKALKLGGIITSSKDDMNETNDTTNTAAEQEEFTYIPATENKDDNEDQDETANKSTDEKTTATNKTTLPFVNDGSFLEQMKKRLEAENSAKNHGDEDDGDDDGGRPKKRQET